MKTVILITNQDDIKQKIQENLVLLRESDEILSVNYDNARDVLFETRPDIVIVHEESDRGRTFDIIKYIKDKSIFAHTNIILFANEYDGAFILSSYDAGISDYITQKSDPSELLIRVINCIKKSEMLAKQKLLESNLKAYGILEAKSGFYSAKYEKDIFDVRLHMDDYRGGSYLMITPSEESKGQFSSDTLISAIKKSIRTQDLVACLSGAKYSILMKSSLDGAIKVFEKIKESLPEGFSIKCGIAGISTEKFDEVKRNAISALNNSLLQNQEYTIYSTDDVETDEWLETPVESEKTYKFFKNVLSKKVEDVIAPLFYRTQKAYESKVGDAKIEQFSDDQQSVFRIISGQNESRLTIRYPGYAKLIIYISHSGLDSPENREIFLPLNQVSEAKLDEILESFINEFIGIYRHMYRY